MIMLNVSFINKNKTSVNTKNLEIGETSEIGQKVEKRINDNNDVLLNPGKGMIFYAGRLYYDDEQKYLLNHIEKNKESLDISTVVYTRYNWSDLQTEEGKFDFTLIDQGIKDCEKLNKKFAFGVMCANVSDSDNPYITPKFVFDKGAKYYKGGENGNQFIPDWEDEIFLKYVDEFVNALGEKYNGNSNIAFIDIRSYGNFGEQHLFGLDVLDEETGKIDEDYTWKNRIEPKFLRDRYIKPYMNAFPDTLLVIPWGEDEFNSVYEELIDEGVSLRRDGICTYTNGLDNCSKTYGKVPLIFEYAKSYSQYTKEQFNSKLEEAIEIAKPSYIELDKEWYSDENQEYCKELANRIGYYFRLKKASYYNKLHLNSETTIDLDFRNDGITPISEDAKVYIGFLNENNELIKKYETSLNPKTWEPGKTVTESIKITLNDIQAGSYKLAVGLYQNETDENPTYLLGSEGKTGNNWYVFGDIELVSKNDDYSYIEKVMKNPPTISEVTDEENLENSTLWCTPKLDDELNPIYKSYNSNLEPLSWKNSMIGHNSIYSTKNKWPQLYSVEFVINSREFFINTCTSFRVLVDEGNGFEITNRDGIEQSTDDTGSETDNFKGKWYKITFNEKKERTIRVELTDCVFNGVRYYEGDEIKATDRLSNERVLFIGSSITRGANDPAYYSWPNVLSNILDFECINNGVGGTGYKADTQGKNDIYYDRLVYLIEELKLNPDIIVIEAGPNDHWSGYTADDIIPEAKRCIDYIKSNTNAKIITIGEYYPSEIIPDNLIDINNKLKQLALEEKVPFIDWLTGDTYNEDGIKITTGEEGYITGTGDTEKPHGDGNADFYVCEDNVHLSIEGNKYFGERLAKEFAKLLNKEPKPEKVINDKNIVSLYCWEISQFNLSKLKDEIEYLGVNTLYIQRPSNDKELTRLREIMEFSKQYNLDVFLLEGARDWLNTENDITKVKEVIDEAYRLNQTLDYKIKGVSLDIEFYLAEEYQNSEDEEYHKELFRIFTENTKKCCDYANSNGLGYSMALPVWLNKLSEEILEDLMNYNYDHIAFMNYYQPTIMENIDEEVEIAKKHNINIVIITELQAPQYVDINDTFYDEGLEDCINTLNSLKEKYNYKRLGTSYHYYLPLLDVLERDTNVGIENKYEIELYPYIDGKSVKPDKAEITSGDGASPIYGFYNEAGEYVVNFYDLEYGKEYTITIKCGNYIGTKTFTYQKGDKEFTDYEIAYLSLNLEQNSEEEKPGENQPSSGNTVVSNTTKNETIKPDTNTSKNETIKPDTNTSKNETIKPDTNTTKNETVKPDTNTSKNETVKPNTNKSKNEVVKPDNNTIRNKTSNNTTENKSKSANNTSKTDYGKNNVDNSISKEKLPNTGNGIIGKVVICSITTIIGFTLFSYIKFKKYSK